MSFVGRQGSRLTEKKLKTFQLNSFLTFILAINPLKTMDPSDFKATNPQLFSAYPLMAATVKTLAAKHGKNKALPSQSPESPVNRNEDFI
ncbi:hypothetical protein [Phaeobacter sp. CECT 5382]|uniref:hypothetical protein n=1 Tax=Phaeobacter sp. CECT 5382 TaxID=1712645 RepID=UPI0012E3EA2F|nr:hypothetical protein [Phaeobacter sp. CECT 5382]